MIDKKANWAQLKKLYEFESSKVSGPGSYRRDIKSVMWTKRELQLGLSLSSEDLKDFEKLIQYLVEKRELMRVPMQDGDDRYVTRVAETVRLLGHNYEYWFRGRQGIDSVRWLVEYKTVPVRSIPAETFMNELIAAVAAEIADDNSTFNLRKAIEMTVIGIASYFEPTDWKKSQFSAFQFQSAKEMILAQFKPRYKHKTQILTAGVGSGKTVAFSIAMFVSAVEGILSGERGRRCHLFLYPRKALALDQSKTLSKMADKIGLEQLTVHFEHHYYYDSQNISVKAGIDHVYGKPGAPPSIIVTTLETLNRRLHHPLVINKLSTYVKRVVLDEIHLVEGIPGCHVVRLMDRLRQACYPTQLLWTGSSATVASPDLHASTVFGVSREEVKIVESRSDNLANVGLVHHVFLRPTGRLSFLGTLVNSTSIIVHNRRDKIWERTGKYQKTIGFADNLDLLGRWNSDFRENERTENVRSRPHPEHNKPWSSRREREIPYALRFFNPLERRINVEGGKEGYEPVLQEFRGKRICCKCKEGQRLRLKKLQKEELAKLGTLVIRDPQNPDDKIKTFYINNKEIFGADELEIGTLDLCPFLNSGACFWFAQDDLEAEQIVAGDKPKWEWRSIARSKVHSSKTTSNIELDEDLSELVFKASKKEVYDLYSEEQINIDVVMASPSLEVGVDLPNVTESMMFKAIRNVASYRQKTGRIGREEGSNSLNTTLLSLRPIDLHYYRQPRKIISQAQLEPIPLKEHNDSILRSALYMAIWDYLALEAEIPEVIPLGDSPSKGFLFTEKLRYSRAFLDSHKNEIAQYLAGISRGKYFPNDNLIDNVIGQVADEIDVFLTPTSGIISDGKISCLSDFIVRFLNPHTPMIPAPNPSWKMECVTLGAKSYKNLRPSISPLLLGLSDEFEELDQLDSSGWIEPNRIRKISERIGARIEELKAAKEKEDETQKLTFIKDHCLATIVSGLEGMKAAGENPIAVYFYQQYDKFKNENKPMAYYLSYTLQGLPIFNLLKRDPAFTTPTSLFVNPFEPAVTLYKKGEVESHVLVSEALFSFIPGTWTYRLGKMANKTLVGKLDSREGGVLIAQLSEISRQGSSFVVSKKLVPAPPGFPSKTLTIYTPTKLTLRQVYEKYVTLNEKTRTIGDKDEDSPFSAEADTEAEPIDEEETDRFTPGRKRVKIPESHLQRWVHIVADEGTRILVNETNQDQLVIEGNDGTKGLEARKKILHPIFDGVLDSVMWHEKLEVYDYVCSVSRSYTSRTVGNGTLMFRDAEGNIGFGYYFRTEGVSLQLSTPTFSQTVLKIKKEMLEYDNKWAPSLIKVLKAALSSKKLPDGTGISPIIVEELLGVLIAASPSIDSKAIIELPKTLKDILETEVEFRNAAKLFYQGKVLAGAKEEEYESKLTEQDRRDIENQVNNLTKLASIMAGFDIDVTNEIEDWITQTLLNTFGLACLSALQRLCGSKEEDVGYSVDMEGIEKNEYRVFLYDRTAHGNGSCDVLRRYLHIMNIQRHRQTDASRLLPTEDFLGLLEQELLQCPQFHTDMDALEKHTQKLKNQAQEGLPELGYVSRYSEEVLRVCGETWKKLGVTGRNDAWKLPLMALSPGSFLQKCELEIDDLIRATTICWNGCPECVINMSAIIGFLGTAFVDKLVLDEWFGTSRALVEEYKTLSVADLATGKARVEIGRQTRVCIELANRRIRSISAPFTIGFEIERCRDAPHASLIVRDADVHGLRIFEKEFNGCAHGIESLGFKRIMWYNLMMSAYVDILGLLEGSRKEIALVFYDCRDVDFDDIGLSNRMLEAIEYHRREAGLPGEIRHLSDIILWLEKEGFKISICVDENRASEDDVKCFLKKLASGGTGNIDLRVKGLFGSMHKKALISPIGVIHGSANLTFSGTQLSEEIISYAPYGSREYEEMKLSILDTFHGSKSWEE